MANWHARVRALGEIAVQLHAVITLGGIVLAVFAAAVAVMSYVLNSIGKLSQYGWGLPVVVAIGIVLASLLVLSLIALAAAAVYRWWCLYRYPDLYRQDTREPGVPRGSPGLTVVPEAAQSAPWKADIDKLGSAVEGYIDATRANFTNEIGQLRAEINAVSAAHKTLATKADLDERFRPIAADIARLNEVGVTQHGATEYVRGQVAALQKEIKDLSERTNHLIKAVRAHDAERDVLIPNDEIVMSLGKRLVEAKATDYPDPVPWLSDYQRWHAAIRAIDRVVFAWTNAEGFGGYAPLLDLQTRHFQNSPMPPDNIRTDDTIIPFKTVWHAQSSYANQRDGIFASFDEWAVLPG